MDNKQFKYTARGVIERLLDKKRLRGWAYVKDDTDKQVSNVNICAYTASGKLISRAHRTLNRTDLNSIQTDNHLGF